MHNSGGVPPFIIHTMTVLCPNFWWWSFRLKSCINNFLQIDARANHNRGFVPDDLQKRIKIQQIFPAITAQDLYLVINANQSFMFLLILYKPCPIKKIQIPIIPIKCWREDPPHKFYKLVYINYIMGIFLIILNSDKLDNST